ncbi:hypothetical protein [Actinacidiphila acidipaludis]|uniref:Excreted virulence factor EspC (Type VII ESX diderm) n=1 Tax=Actinacidiphila acidipaludis TaxID=2873382 RepID=A0ABS7QBJ1_9ACTN|nr:hypothetical protein [Streptomyces acidipaludis]MBY8880537.1 hypothetical protein [Streptomyces acidipaludis]
MGDLEADTRRIRDCSRALQRIYDQFTGHADPAEGYSSDELGDSRITDAFHDFGSNWKIHREHLAEGIRTLGTIAEDAADTYEGIDARLADALRRQDAAAKTEEPPR